MKAHHKRRALSDIVGVLIMVAIIVSLGLLTYAFANGSVGTLSGSYGGVISNKAQAISEKFSVEQFNIASHGTLALDGTNTNQVAGSSSSIATTITTKTTNDVILAYVSPADTGSTAPPSVSSISGGGLTWNHRVSTPTETYSQYNVPITLTNNQGSATPTTFQQQITWNPSTYSAYEASDLGNVRFCADSACVTTLNAWLESCTSTCVPSDTTAKAWVKLTSSIAGGGGMKTIYIVFLPTSTDFDGNHWGEAPTISATYGQFDNGANVFTLYDNFAGTVLNAGKWTITASSGGSVVVNNGVQFTTSGGSDYAFIGSATATFPYVSEAYFTIRGGGTDPMLGETTALTANACASVGLFSGYEIDRQSGNLYLNSQISTGCANVVTSAESFSPGIWSFVWSATGAQVGTDGNGVTDTGADGTITIANYRMYVGQSSAGNGNDNAQWARTRAYPPSNVMPTTAFGSTGSTPLATLDLEEWYAAASSTLSSATITATLSASATAAIWIAVYGISDANTPTPFDPNVSLPVTSAGTTPSTTMSTSNANDLLLYSCAAEGGAMAYGFTSIYSSTFPPNASEFVGYEKVSATQTNLVTSCGTNSYGAEITDALAASHGGAAVYVRNLGTIPTSLVSVFIVDQSTGALISQVAITATVSVGALVYIPDNTLAFTPTHGHTYSFTVTSNLGNSVTFYGKAP